MKGRPFSLVRALSFVLLFLVVICLSTLAQADNLTRGLWRGQMSQKSPMPWKCPMELYLRFDEEDSFPAKITGVITWETLGKARTSIEGQMLQNGTISFTETACLSGDCSKVVLGGTYRGTIRGEHLSGKATGLFGLQGDFELTKSRL
jgi:hypothetical protein